LNDARAEATARQFQVKLSFPAEARVRGFRDLPKTVTLQKALPNNVGRFEILYTDGADLMRQLAEFLAVAGVNREEFFAATEPADAPSR
jgi:hypothetical protein